MFGIICFSIALVAGWQAQVLLRRFGPAQRLYAYLLIADGVAAGVAAAAGGDEPSAWSELVGAVAIFAFAGMVILPPILREAARRALARDRFALARGLTALREHLSPGLGARQELEFIEIEAAVRAGRVDQVLAALRTRKAQVAEPLVRQAIDDRIMFTLLDARRWREAIDLFEQVQAASGPTSVHLAVEVVRAYGEAGDLDRAAALLARLEGSKLAHEPALLQLVWRARMLLLAFAGRAQAVEALVVGAGPLAALPAAARSFWIGTARLYAGDRAGARAALTDSLRASGHDRRGREVAGDRLRQVDDPGLEVPRPLSDDAHLFTDRLVQTVGRPAPGGRVPLLSRLPWRATPATAVLIILNSLVFLLVTALLGSSEDPWVLVRAGANFKPAVLGGEWWRLYASTFLHVGAIHLLVNMFGLWQLGRLVEQLFGSSRFAAIYFLAGVGGAAASLFFGGSGVSAGASGAVFGILGAAIAELIVDRRRDGDAAASGWWRRPLLQNLLFIACANLVVGAVYPMIDQSAHVGGLVVGALAGALLTPSSRLGGSAVMDKLARAFMFLALVAGGWSAVAAATTPYSSTLSRVGWERRDLGGASLELPRSWVEVGGSTATDPTWQLSPSLTVEVVPPAAAAARRQQIEDKLRNDPGVVEAAPAESSLPAPAPWRGGELRFFLGEAGKRWPLRQAVFERPIGERVALLTFVLPEARVPDAGPVIERILLSLNAVVAK